MPITFVPKRSQVLMCDFESDGFIRPEMQKIRHCVVVSPRYRRSTGTCLVVPLSTQEPELVGPRHYAIAADKYSFFKPGCVIWAKADMLTHAGFQRLDRVMDGGRYSTRCLDDTDFLGLMRAVVNAVGLPHLAGNL